MASRYHAGFAAVTMQSVDALLEAAKVTSGVRMLDVACGPGYAAAAAAARGAAPTGIDFSSEMVDEKSMPVGSAPRAAAAAAAYPGPHATSSVRTPDVT